MASNSLVYLGLCFYFSSEYGVRGMLFANGISMVGRGLMSLYVAKVNINRLLIQTFTGKVFIGLVAVGVGSNVVLSKIIMNYLE
jgi:hypothetical protein